REAVLIVRMAVREGGTLAEKMAELPELFPATVRQLFAAGEATGSLAEAALRAAGTLQTLDRLVPDDGELPECGVRSAECGVADVPLSATPHSALRTPHSSASAAQEAPGRALAT